MKKIFSFVAVLSVAFLVVGISPMLTRAEDEVVTEETVITTPVDEIVQVPKDPAIELSKKGVYDGEHTINYTIKWKVVGGNVKDLVLTDTIPAWTDGNVSSVNDPSNPPTNPVLGPGDLTFHPATPTDNREIIWELGDQTWGASGSIKFSVEIWNKATCRVAKNKVHAEALYDNHIVLTADALSDAFKVEDPHCEVPDETATISAVKIVCPTEDLLPNWGDHSLAQITSTTASDFLEENPTCHAAEWNFQWAPSSTGNPGNNTTGTPTGWTSFSGSTNITLPVTDSYVWVRENVDTNYIPFSEDTTAPYDDVSAEVYCNTDILNYDNYDRVDDLTEAGKTYYCVAFNAPKVEEPETCDPEVNLLSNGGFENPTVTSGTLWDIFPSGTPGLSWLAAWINPTGAPETANLELQENGLNGWAASEGTQWTELDSDWDGPAGSLNGEAGQVAISQDVTTIADEDYTVAFDFSPRPGTGAGDNKVEVLADNTLIGTVGPVAPSGTTAWTSHSFNFEAADNSTTITFRDAGTPNDSLGTLIDNASVKCADDDNPPGDDNLPPTADAGPDQSITLPTDSTNLDGTGTDSDGVIVSYVWTQVSGPALDPNDIEDPAIGGLVEGTYVFKLTVTDDDGATDDDEVTIIVNPESNDGDPGDETFVCSDGQDNDGDGLADENDPGCINQNSGNYDPHGSSEENGDNGGGGGGGGFSSGSSRRPGQVLGAEAVCNFAIDTYMRRGYRNNIDQVFVLQALLNKYVEAGLAVDGDFGAKTEAAVKAFQVKYRDNILQPWGLTNPTGIFYKTTLVQAKNLECPTSILPIPADLINWSKNPKEVPTPII